MPSSKNVFALRKSGSLDEAYALALTVIQSNPDDDWNRKALAWCLYDLTKRSVSKNDYNEANIYLQQLESLEIDDSDDILFKSIEHVRIVANPQKKVILQAREQSKLGNHEEALLLFEQAIQKFPDDIDLNNQFGWELQKKGKIIFDTDKIDILKARKLLVDYIKLNNERPSQLHSLFLRFADKITDKEEFNLISFLKLWDLNNLRTDDFESFIKEGKSYPSIAEKVIQHAAKLILEKKLHYEVDYFLPFLDKAIKRFQDNIWLPYYKAKILHLVNRNEEAIEFLIPVVKEKITEYWTWSLLADLVLESDTDLAVSCFCKALLCKGEEKFISNVRIKLSELLIQKQFWNEAKFEIGSVILTKESEKAIISDRLKNHQQSEWYKNAVIKKSNNDFYISQKQGAEEFVFHSLPWIDGCLGETFTTPENPNKPRRKIYLKLPNENIEVTVSDRRFNASRNYVKGDSIKIKGEYSKEKAFQIYLLDKRASQEKWDIFNWYKGNIIQGIKKDNDKIIAWRVSVVIDNQVKEGIIEEKDISAKFQIKEGLPVFVKFYQKEQKHTILSILSGKEPRIHILSIKERNEGRTWDTFPEDVGIIDHVNKEKGIAHFIVSKKVNGTVKLNQINERIEIGNKVLLRQKKVKKDRESYYAVLTCSVTDQEPKETLLRSFKGMVELSGSVGFADDVYIESSLIQEYNITDGIFLSGTAILNYNKKKGTWGWKAISILTNG